MKKTILALAMLAGFCTASLAQTSATPASTAAHTKKHTHKTMHKQAALTNEGSAENKTPASPAKKEMKQPMVAHHKKATSAVKKTTKDKQ